MSTITRPVLTAGTQHEDVHQLGRLLADAGYENSVSRGENPFGLVDETLLTAANAYRIAQGVEPETDIPGVPEHEQQRWIGPVLWEALVPTDESESDEQRAAREQREAGRRAAKAAELRAQLADLEPEPEPEPTPSTTSAGWTPPGYSQR